jgi:hypothetical protein
VAPLEVVVLNAAGAGTGAVVVTAPVEAEGEVEAIMAFGAVSSPGVAAVTARAEAEAEEVGAIRDTAVVVTAPAGAGAEVEATSEAAAASAAGMIIAGEVVEDLVEAAVGSADDQIRLKGMPLLYSGMSALARQPCVREAHVCHRQNTNIPQPDALVTILEDKILKQQAASSLTAKMGQVSLSSTRTAGSVNNGFFPCRPAFGTRGQEVVLWANYFQLTIKESQEFYKFAKYTIEVTRVQPAAQPSQGASEVDNKPKGKKLKAVIEIALQGLDKSVPYATEFKSQVVSRRPLNLPNGNVIQVEHTEPGRDRAAKYEVKFNGPTEASIVDLKQYLRTMRDPADPTGQSFPKFENTIDAIGVILGHTPRASNDVVAVGKGRFFPVTRAAETGKLGDKGLLNIIRGYFQSVRPATGRLLLNANVTHGIFRPSGKISDMIDNMGLNYIHQLKGNDTFSFNKGLDRLSRSISKARVRITMFDERKNSRVVEKGISGFAMASDINKRDRDHRPRFPSGFKYGGPGQVSFFLKAPGRPQQANPKLPGGKYYTVSHYYKSSQYCLVCLRSTV